MIMGIIEAVFTAITKPATFIKNIVTSAFYWLTRTFGIGVAAFSKEKGE